MEKFRICVRLGCSLSKVGVSRLHNNFKLPQVSIHDASLLTSQFFSTSRPFSSNISLTSVFHGESDGKIQENERFDDSKSHEEKTNAKTSLDLMKSIIKGQREEIFCKNIPVRAYFLCPSINLKNIQVDNESKVIPLTSRSSNYVTLQFPNLSSRSFNANGQGNGDQYSYMIVFQYGSVVLFNVEDVQDEEYLDIVRRHATGLICDVKKDDYTVQENPLLIPWMEVGLDYIVLQKLDPDGMRIIASVLGQSVALDHFVRQVDDMVEEFTDINRGLESTGTFTMDRKKLFQLVGRANTNVRNVIMKLGLFERSEIAWRDANYAQILEYLRDEYELAQRLGSLDFKLKFVEHNIQFFLEVLQHRRTDFSEWCIIFLIIVSNMTGIYNIFNSISSAH